MNTPTTVNTIAASTAAGHPFQHEESARLYLQKLDTDSREYHLKRARLKVYLRSQATHSKLISQAVWDKAFARV